MTAAIRCLMLKFFMMDGKWDAIDVAEGVDYPRTSSGFRKGNIAFRLIIFTVVVRSMSYLYLDYFVQTWLDCALVTRPRAPTGP